MNKKEMEHNIKTVIKTVETDIAVVQDSILTNFTAYTEEYANGVLQGRLRCLQEYNALLCTLFRSNTQ